MLARRGAFTLLTLASLALFALPAHATVMVEIPIEDLVARSELVVRAHVLRTGTQLVTFDGRLEPHTISELRVEESLVGEAATRITIDELGGEVAGQGRWIDGTPRYRDGEEVIVFLGNLPSGAYRTVGMVQGCFEVVHARHGDGGFVERDTRSIAFASWVDGEMQLRDGGRAPRVDLATFVGLVTSIAEQLALPGSTETTGGAR